MKPAANDPTAISDEILRIFEGAKPASLTKAEAAVAELRDELEELNRQLHVEAAVARQSGRVQPSASMKSLQNLVAACEDRVKSARRKLAAEREAFLPKFLSAIADHRQSAGESIFDAVSALERAETILAAIENRATLAGLSGVDRLSPSMQVRHALREIGRRCGGIQC